MGDPVYLPAHRARVLLQEHTRTPSTTPSSTLHSIPQTTEDEIRVLREACERALNGVRARAGEAAAVRLRAEMAAYWGMEAAISGGAAGLEHFEMNLHANGRAVLSSGT